MWRITSHLNGGNIIFALWSAGLSFFAPIGWWLVACAFMVGADFVTGLWAARIKGELWTSNKMRKSLTKCGSYLFLIICARIFEGVLPSYVEQAEIARIFTAFIVGVELFSIMENLYAVTGNRVFYILTQFTSKKLKDISGEEYKKE